MGGAELFRSVMLRGDDVPLPCSEALVAVAQANRKLKEVDLDGILDVADRCPNDAETANGKISLRNGIRLPASSPYK